MSSLNAATYQIISKVIFNIDENPATPQQYGVRGIPALLIFENGQVKAEKIVFWLYAFSNTPFIDASATLNFA